MRRTVIDTYKSILRAYYEVGEIPIVGPGLCTVLALSAYVVVLLFLLIPILCFAQDVHLARLSPGLSVGVSVPAAPAGDSCTGSLLLSAHFENSDTITEGLPAGCSAGDTTWTRTNSTFTTSNVQDGTYALLLDANGDDAVLSISSGDICSSVAGRFDLWVYFDNASSDGNIITSWGDNSNHIFIDAISSEFTFRYRSTDGGATTLNTTVCNLTNATAYHVIARWRQGVTDPALSISCYDSGDNLLETVSNNDNLSAMTTVPTTLIVGNNGGYAIRGKIDSVKIYNTYSD